jgi:hypothetical protein
MSTNSRLANTEGLPPQDEEGYCTMSFDYDIIDSCSYERHELENDNDFAKHLGSILEQILTEAVEKE